MNIEHYTRKLNQQRASAISTKDVLQICRQELKLERIENKNSSLEHKDIQKLDKYFGIEKIDSLSENKIRLFSPYSFSPITNRQSLFANFDLSEHNTFAIYLHDDVLSYLTDRASPKHILKKIYLVFFHLSFLGSTPVIKGVIGKNKGWRRSPVNGNADYLWWTTPHSHLIHHSNEGRKVCYIRAIRKHDETDIYINPGQVSDYPTKFDIYDLLQENKLSTPFLDYQFHFIHRNQKIKLLQGHPGTGKTTTLLLASTSEEKERILFITKSAKLQAHSMKYFDVYSPKTMTVESKTFKNFLIKLLHGRERNNTRYTIREKDFIGLIDRLPPGTLGIWNDYNKSMFCEILAHIFGYSLPIPFRKIQPSNSEIIDKNSYLKQYTGEYGEKAALDLYNFSISKKEELLTIFPYLKIIFNSFQKLASENQLPPEKILKDWHRYDKIIIDEAQDLFLSEIFIILEFVKLLNKRRPDHPVELYIAGDEGQTVRTTNFSWGVLKGLIGEIFQSKDPQTELFQYLEFNTNVRSPKEIVQVINNSWSLYKLFYKGDRPQGQSKVTEINDTIGDIRLVYYHSDQQLIQFIKNLQKNPHSKCIAPDKAGFIDNHPKLFGKGKLENDHIESSSSLKGLDFPRVFILGTHELFQKLERLQQIEGNDKEIASIEGRIYVDSFRVAISRANEMVFFIEKEGNYQDLHKKPIFNDVFISTLPIEEAYQHLESDDNFHTFREFLKLAEHYLDINLDRAELYIGHAQEILENFSTEFKPADRQEMDFLYAKVYFQKYLIEEKEERFLYLEEAISRLKRGKYNEDAYCLNLYHKIECGEDTIQKILNILKLIDSNTIAVSVAYRSYFQDYIPDQFKNHFSLQNFLQTDQVRYYLTCLYKYAEKIHDILPSAQDIMKSKTIEIKNELMRKKKYRKALAILSFFSRYWQDIRRDKTFLLDSIEVYANTNQPAKSLKRLLMYQKIGHSLTDSRYIDQAARVYFANAEIAFNKQQFDLALQLYRSLTDIKQSKQFDFFEKSFQQKTISLKNHEFFHQYAQLLLDYYLLFRNKRWMVLEFVNKYPNFSQQKTYLEKAGLAILLNPAKTARERRLIPQIIIQTNFKQYPEKCIDLLKYYFDNTIRVEDKSLYNHLFTCYKYAAEIKYKNNQYEQGYKLYEQGLFFCPGKKKILEISIMNIIRSLKNTGDMEVEEGVLRLLLARYFFENEKPSLSLKIMKQLHSKDPELRQNREELEKQSFQQIISAPTYQDNEVEFYPRIAHYLLSISEPEQAFSFMSFYKNHYTRKKAKNFETLYLNCHLVYGLELLKQSNKEEALEKLKIFLKIYRNYKQEGRVREEKILLELDKELEKFTDGPEEEWRKFIHLAHQYRQIKDPDTFENQE